MKMQKDCFNLLAGSRNDHVTSSAGLLIGLSYSKYKMVFGQAGRVFARKFSTSAVARSQHWQQYGIPGAVCILLYQISCDRRRFVLFF